MRLNFQIGVLNYWRIEMKIKSVPFLRDNMPLDNIHSALILSKKVKYIEELYNSKKTEFPTREHKAYSLGAIYTIIGFLESSINDLFYNAKDNFTDHLKGVENYIEKLSAFEKNDIYNKLKRNIQQNIKPKILRKYQYALQLMGMPFIDVKDEKLVDLITLIYIRNSFTHHYATWRECGSDAQSEYEELKGRFAENPLYNKGNPFFPDKLLGYGFLQWSIDLSIRFVIEFYNKIGLKYTYMNRLEEKLEENGLLKTNEKESAPNPQLKPTAQPYSAIS